MNTTTKPIPDGTALHPRLFTGAWSGVSRSSRFVFLELVNRLPGAREEEEGIFELELPFRKRKAGGLRGLLGGKRKEMRRAANELEALGVIEFTGESPFKGSGMSYVRVIPRAWLPAEEVHHG